MSNKQNFSIRQRVLDLRHWNFVVRQIKLEAAQKLFEETRLNQIYSFRWDLLEERDEDGEWIKLKLWLGEIRPLVYRPKPIRKISFLARLRVLWTGEYPMGIEAE